MGVAVVSQLVQQPGQGAGPSQVGPLSVVEVVEDAELEVVVVEVDAVLLSVEVDPPVPPPLPPPQPASRIETERGRVKKEER